MNFRQWNNLASKALQMKMLDYAPRFLAIIEGKIVDSVIEDDPSILDDWFGCWLGVRWRGLRRLLSSGRLRQLIRLRRLRLSRLRLLPLRLGLLRQGGWRQDQAHATGDDCQAHAVTIARISVAIRAMIPRMWSAYATSDESPWIGAPRAVSPMNASSRATT